MSVLLSQEHLVCASRTRVRTPSLGARGLCFGARRDTTLTPRGTRLGVRTPLFQGFGQQEVCFLRLEQQQRGRVGTVHAYLHTALEGCVFGVSE